MSLFTELKRRNVFRVGIAYAIVAWLVLQVADLVLDNIAAPGWVMQTIMLVIGIGFPVVLVFAWAFELTPEGIKRESEVDRGTSITPQTGKKLNTAILVLMALAIAYLLFDKFSGTQPDSVSTPAAEMAREAAQPEAEPALDMSPGSDRQSIAVLPFTNRSRNEDDAFFVDGIHDDLLTNLARISGLKVISRTSVMRFKDTDKPIPEIASELGVATVMEGAVQRSGSTVRINVQLIDAQTDEHLWAQIFDRELTADNLFAIQSEISQAIASALETTLSPQEQNQLNERPTKSLEAYNAYLKGRQLMALHTSNSVTQADTEFRRAVELDPDFALAWAALAENARWLRTASNVPWQDSVRTSREAAERAIALDPDLGEAYVTLAFLDAFEDSDFEAAEVKFRKAIQLSPGFAQAYDWYSDLLQTFPGRRREALAMIRKAEELDPFSPEIQSEIAQQLRDLGQYEAAESQARRVIRLNPEYVSAQDELARILADTGRFGESVFWTRKAVAQDPGRILRYMDMAFTLLDLQDPAAVAEVQSSIAAIDPDHFANGAVSMVKALASKNYAAAEEAGNWVRGQVGSVPNFESFLGVVHILNNDYARARHSFEIAFPEYFDRTTWRKGLERVPEMGCFMPLVLGETGDEAMANDLLKLATNYLEYELPGYIEHAHRYFTEACYALAGDYDQAITYFASSVAHGHYSGWWFALDLPVFDTIRGDPRFLALVDQIHAHSAEQREILARLEAEAGP